MDKFISRFIINKIKGCAVLAIPLSLLTMLFGLNYLLQYLYGFLVGCLNFILLSIGINVLVNKRFKMIRLFHFLFFTTRYALIAYLIVRAITNRGFNPFVIIFGFLTMNFSIKIHAFKGCLVAKKEG